MPPPDLPIDRSGLYVMPDGTRAFVDFDCEERWIQSMVEQQEAELAYDEREEELYRLSLEALDALEPDDGDPPPRRERPRGLLLNLEDPHASS